MKGAKAKNSLLNRVSSLLLNLFCTASFRKDVLDTYLQAEAI